MKTKYYKLLAVLAASPLLMHAQNRPDATLTDRSSTPPSSVTAANNDGSSVDASDAGAQRPIFLKTENITAFVGLDSKYFYRNNPLSSSVIQNETAMWMNTAYAGASFEPIEVEDAVITPYVGTSYTSTDYLDIDGLNFFSTSAYCMLLAQHSNGWAYRLGISYAMDKTDITDEETYLSGGFHSSESDSSFSANKKELNNIDFTASYGLQYIYENFIISPRYSATFKSYTEGSTSSNDGREDLIHSLSVKIDYPIDENFNISLFGGYSKRDAKSSFADFDFQSADGGIALGLNTTF
jgi:hypothetical protein